MPKRWCVHPTHSAWQEHERTHTHTHTADKTHPSEEDTNMNLHKIFAPLDVVVQKQPSQKWPFFLLVKWVRTAVADQTPESQLSRPKGNVELFFFLEIYLNIPSVRHRRLRFRSILRFYTFLNFLSRKKNTAKEENQHNGSLLLVWWWKRLR